MAMSFARPDPSSPTSVADAAFATTRRGFDQNEVRDFLRMVAAELGRLQERERFLERELRSAQSNPDLESVNLDEQTLTRLLGEETARVLMTARESASEIRAKAEESAKQMLGEAGSEASRVREEAEVEVSRRRTDAGADAEAEVAMAKQQGREMVNEARAYRERVLSELARRRELAREQIEQLLHGRDRLMQSFERARIVAVDVVAELQPLGEPDEYVNLSPTTGPVPVMVPNSPRPKPVDSQPLNTDSPSTESPNDESPNDEEADTEAVDAEEPQAEEREADESEGLEHQGEPASEDSASAEPEAEPADDAEAVVEISRFSDAIETGDVGDQVTDLEEVAEGGAAQVVDSDADSNHANHDDVVVDLFARLRADAVDDDVVGNDEVVGNDAVEQAAPDLVEEAVVIPLATDDQVSAEDDVEAAPTAFEQRDIELTPLIVASAKKLKRVLADEQNEVLDALRRNDSVRAIDELLPSSGEHSARYHDAIADEFAAAAQAGCASICDGGKAKLAKAKVTLATDAAAEVMREWLVMPLRERLEGCLSDGDGDTTEITKHARAVYREWKTKRIDEQLDDVFLMAFGRGAFAAIDVGVPVVWTTDSSLPACADCEDNTLAGAVPAGQDFPTGDAFAPAHIGCRCLLLRAGS